MTLACSRRLIHGTYIQDNPRWKYQKEITVDQAAMLLGIPKEERETPPPCTRCQGTRKIKGSQCHECGGSGKQHEYLWLNKGFIVIGQELRRSDDFKIENGMQAIYIHDGKYRLYAYVPLAQMVS